jgi:hypothetical protein
MTEEAQSHHLVFAATQSGKGVKLALPDLSNWRGTIIIHDPKPSLPDWGTDFKPDPDRRTDWNKGKPDEGDDQ